MINITDLQRDAITESINISMGKAASTFNSMIQEHIALSVPKINFVSSEEALDILQLPEEKEVCYIKQHFSGTYFTSEAMLVFAQDESLELVKLFLGEETSVADMTTLEHEAMSEIGNVLLNACIGSLSNILKDRISGTLPIFRKCKAQTLFLNERKEEVILLIFVDFGIESKAIKGYIVLILELDSFIKFKEQLLKNLMG
ncbi:MAG: hypothetical protein ABUK01_03855 [Leptospirales bacterium]